MPFTVVVTRNAPPRTRGFLASTMLEVAPGVYMAPRMTKGVRERIWRVMIEWHDLLPPDGGVVMTFPDNSSPGGQGILILGSPKMELVEVDGFWLTRTIKDPSAEDGNAPTEGMPASPESAP